MFALRTTGVVAMRGQGGGGGESGHGEAMRMLQGGLGEKAERRQAGGTCGSEVIGIEAVGGGRRREGR